MVIVPPESNESAQPLSSTQVDHELSVKACPPAQLLPTPTPLPRRGTLTGLVLACQQAGTRPSSFPSNGEPSSGRASENFPTCSGIPPMSRERSRPSVAP